VDVGFTSDTDTVLGETIPDALCSVQYVKRLLAEVVSYTRKRYSVLLGDVTQTDGLVLVEQCTGR